MCPVPCYEQNKITMGHLINTRSSNETRKKSPPNQITKKSSMFFPKQINQLMVIYIYIIWCCGARWFGFLGSPYERDCYFGSQTTGPQTIGPQTVSSESTTTFKRWNPVTPMFFQAVIGLPPPTLPKTKREISENRISKKEIRISSSMHFLGGFKGKYTLHGSYGKW